MKKFLMVIPPSGFLLDERVFPSLGILKVAAVLERKYEIEVLDLSGEEDPERFLFRAIFNMLPDFVCFTATTPQFPKALQLASIVQGEGIETVIGGPHATLTHAAMKKQRGEAAWKQVVNGFDRVIVGDGEKAILDIENSIFIDADDRKSSYFMNNDTYERSPWPARHLIDLESYKYEIEGHKATSLISQLGCPFNCGFCGGRNSHSLRVVRNRSETDVISEIRFLHDTYGYTGFMFYDDELNVNPRFVNLMNGLSDLQEKLGVDFRLRGFIKAELFNEEQAKAMYRAGFRWILSGFEAADEQILLNINKRATLDDNSRVIEIAKKNNLKTKALMSIGHPGESWESCISVSSWLIRMEVEDFDCTIITPYPGSPYYDDAIPYVSGWGKEWMYEAKSGDRLYMKEIDYANTEDYYKGIPGEYKCYVRSDELSAEDLIISRDTIESVVRRNLKIEYPGKQFESSMGQQ